MANGNGVPPGAITPLESLIIRWAATLLVPIVSFALKATHLDKKLGIDAVTDSAIYNAVMGVLGAVAIWKIIKQRLRLGEDPANLNVPPVVAPPTIASIVQNNHREAP